MKKGVKKLAPLSVQALRTRIDAKEISAASELTGPTHPVDFIGRERAQEALETGVNIAHEGFNVYALGTSGSGKHEMILHFLKDQAVRKRSPSDWCYVHNFANAKKPIALKLPSGLAPHFAKAMADLVDDLRSAIPAIFESSEYRDRRDKIDDEYKQKETQGLAELGKQAEKFSVIILNTPGGFITAPAKDGEVMNPDEFGKLSEEERIQRNRQLEDVSKQLKIFLESVAKWRKERREKEKVTLKEFVETATGFLIQAIKDEYAAQEGILRFLREVEKDVVEHIADFHRSQEPRSSREELFTRGSPFGRYQVNVLVTNDPAGGAPIIYEDNPTFANLTGKIEHEAVFGALVTDFSLLHAGALHRANGGFLILDAERILSQPYAWEGLKRRLLAKTITIETLEHQLGLLSTTTLEPEAIELDTKVVLVGDRRLYYLLSAYDPDFAKLFKIAADFDDTIARTSMSHFLYLRYLLDIILNCKLLPFSSDALALAMEESMRLAGDVDKFSLHKRTIENLLIEAHHYAQLQNAAEVTRSHLQLATQSAIKRSDRIKDLIHEEIEKGVIQIATKGSKEGQVNGLSIVELGEHMFGHPTRITARVRYGQDGVVDIQRETKMGGAIHSKGVFILSAYIQGTYAINEPLSLSASLVFEQTYGFVEGDSASVAELCAVLSALAEVPIDQSLAVTGSVNQMGEVQAIGGVNEKIEGFFDACKRIGLTGDQGVLIPESNVRNLMLREDVLKACEEGSFHVFAIRTVDEALLLLTKTFAGKRNRQGKYERSSLNARIERRLLKYAKRSKAAG